MFLRCLPSAYRDHQHYIVTGIAAKTTIVNEPSVWHATPTGMNGSIAYFDFNVHDVTSSTEHALDVLNLSLTILSFVLKCRFVSCLNAFDIRPIYPTRAFMWPCAVPVTNADRKTRMPDDVTTKEAEGREREQNNYDLSERGLGRDGFWRSIQPTPAWRVITIRKIEGRISAKIWSQWER